MKVNQNRSLAMYIILTILTLGIYALYNIYSIAKDVNTMCEGDGERTTGLFMFIVLTVITCGIYAFVWYYKLGNRLKANGPKYGVNINENGDTVLLCMILGTMICCIASFVGFHIIFKNCNALATAYNNGGFSDDDDYSDDFEESFEDVKEDIITTLAGEYLKKNSIASIRGLQEIRDEYKLEIVDSELKTQYAEYIQNALNYYQQMDNQSTTQKK